MIKIKSSIKTIDKAVTKMISFYFISALFINILPVFSALNTIKCDVPNGQSIPSDSSCIINYDRKSVNVYNYSSTPYANFLVYDAEVLCNNKNTSLLKTDIEGIGYFQRNTNNRLTKCKVNIEKNAKFNDKVSEDVKQKIVELASICAEQYLCDSLNDVEIDDIIAGKIDHHDFGENSALFKELGKRFPNIDLPVQKYTGDAGLQTTLNFLVDFWLASLIKQMTKDHVGIVKLPDVNETITGVNYVANDGYFHLTNGTLGNLRYFKRSQDVIVSNNGLEFSVKGGLELNDAKVHYKHYHLKYALLNTDGTADFHVDKIKFEIKVSMNYNQEPCKTSAPNIHTEIGKIDFNLTNSNIFEGLISDISTLLVRKITKNLTSFMQFKLKEAITTQLNNFDCEQFRP